MKKSTFEYVDSLGDPLSENFLVGTKEQAEAFTKIIHGHDDLIKVRKLAPANKGKYIDKIVLDDLRFICSKNSDGVAEFEMSYNNHHYITGFQDSVSGSMVIEEDEATPQYEVDIKLFVLFPGFEFYAVCENCQNTGSWDIGEGPESKVVECSDHPNVIFEYE